MKKTQITLSVKGRPMWERRWHYVPRIGEFIKGDDGEWYKIDEISWHTPTHEGEGPAMVTLDIHHTRAR